MKVKKTKILARFLEPIGEKKVSTERMKAKLKVLTTCNIEAEKWIDYIENELDPSMKADLGLHLSHCEICQENYSTFKVVLENAKSSSPMKLPSDEFFKNLERKIMGSLDEKTVAQQVVAAAVVTRVASWTRRVTIPLAASAALFLLVLGALYKTVKFNTEINPEVAQAKLEEQFIVQAAKNNPEVMSNSMISHEGQEDLVITAAAEKLSKMSRRDAARFMRSLR